jgi:nicotinate dehydrogenase subunit B
MAVLKEQVRFDRTRITTRTWDDYPILRFSEAPAVEVSIIDRPDEPSLGVGEAVAGPPVAASIANAAFDAIGVRVRDLPLTRERMLAAINDA